MTNVKSKMNKHLNCKQIKNHYFFDTLDTRLCLLLLKEHCANTKTRINQNIIFRD
jgi:hypothetical protein